MKKKAKLEVETASDLPGMPERDEVGTAALAVVQIKNKIKTLTAAFGTAKDVLRDAMIRNKRASVTVEGVSFFLETKEAEEKIRAIWPK